MLKYQIAQCQNIEVVKYQSDQNLDKSKCMISNFQNFKSQQSSAKQREAKQSKMKRQSVELKVDL